MILAEDPFVGKSFMKEKVFVDTNIIFYAHDQKSPKKQVIASNLIQKLWQSKELPLISVQVLQELFVNLTKHIKTSEAETVIDLYRHWEVIENSVSIFNFAIRILKTDKISFWDSLIVSAAHYGKAKVIYSEDLNHGQVIQGVKILNPFQNS